MKNNTTIITDFLSNLQLKFYLAHVTKCDILWRRIDFVPDFNRLYFIIDGDGMVSVNDKTYYPKKHQLVLLPAGVKQSYSYINDNYYYKYYCHFNATAGGLNLFDVIKTPYVIDVEDPEIMIDTFKQLMHYSTNRTTTSEVYIKSLLYKLLALYIDNCNNFNIELIHDSSVNKLKNIVNYIENNLDKQISNAQLAKLIYMHPNYFIKFFKKHMGHSPQNYINMKKLDFTKLLLVNTNYSISKIALNVGFENSLYFSKMFKKYTGFSPSEYRRINNP